MGDLGDKTIRGLRDLNNALRGKDSPGDGNCEICGRTGVKTFRTHRGKMSIDLCGPCLNESIRKHKPGKRKMTDDQQFNNDQVMLPASEVLRVLQCFAKDAQSADDGEFSTHVVNCARAIARRLGLPSDWSA